MCCKKPPFESRKGDKDEIELKIKNGIYQDIPSIYSIEIKDLINKLLSKNPLNRPTIE